MEEKLYSLKKTARIAGVWYLLLVIAGIYSLMFVSSQIMVSGNTAATAHNILAHEFLFRTGIFSELISNVIFLFLVLALYKLLKEVNGHQAKLMVALVLVQIPVSVLIEVFNITSLMILKGEVMKALIPAQKQDLAMLFLNIHKYGIIILEIFWGLWLIPFGQLVYKSGFIPWIIGVALIIGGITYMIESFTFLLFPVYNSFISQFDILSSIGEFAIMLWLLIKGVKVHKTQIDVDYLEMK